MPRLSRLSIHRLVHEALAVRVRLLLGQAGFDELLATQGRVSLALAQGAGHAHAPRGADGSLALAQAVVDAFELDPNYYDGSAMDFLVSEGLASAGLALADAVRGHEQDGRARWQSEVVPQLDRIEAFVVRVFDGNWAREPGRVSLRRWLAA